MPEYIPYTTDEYQPEAPATALHFARWFQNWEAGFEGAPGAPKVAGAALGGVYLGFIDRVDTTTPQGFNDLGRWRTIILHGRVGTATTSTDVQIRFSSDNGATWSAWTIIVDGASAVRNVFCVISVEKQNDIVRVNGINGTAAFDNVTSVSIPDDANAFQLSFTNSGSSAALKLHTFIMAGDP